MRPLSRVRALAAAYAACLAMLAWTAIGSDSHRPESEGFVVGAALLAAVALVLGDMPRWTRAWATVAAVAYFLSLSLPAMFVGTSDEFQLINGSEAAARSLLAMLTFVVGMLLLVRTYLGTIGLALANRGRPRPSLRALLGIAAYFGLVALAFTISLPRDSEQRVDLFVSNAIAALVLSAASIGPVFAVLGTSITVRACGAAMLAGTFALLAWSLSEAWHDPLFWRLACALGGALLTPFVGAVVLRASGYRLRSTRQPGNTG